MIASLPMYDWPEVRAETDLLWESLRDHLAETGLDAPAALSREGDLWETWLNPSLTLSQTCGLPYSAKLTGRCVLLGAPVYDLPVGTEGTYHSVIIARGDGATIANLKGARFAYNMRESQSGWAALDRTVPIREHFGELTATGAHRDSLKAVAEGRADCAALDAVAWVLAQRHEPAAQQVAAIAVTSPTPGLPFITGAANADKAASARRAIADAIAALDGPAREALALKGFKAWGEEDYAPLAAGWPDPEA